MYENLVSILQTGAIISKESTVSNKGKRIIGWNKYVAHAHGKAKIAFQMWVLAGKPISGPFYQDMCDNRKIFKGKIKWCQNKQEQIKMDILAAHNNNKNFKDFWKHTNKLNAKPGLPVSVGGLSDSKEISNLFKEHFKVEATITDSTKASDAAMFTDLQQLVIRFSAKEIKQVIHKMKRGKSPGHDGLSIEHLTHAGPHLSRILSMFFSLCLGHSHLPSDLMKTVVVPIVKNKTGDISDKNNYRPISLATIIAKVLDSLLGKHLDEHLNLHDAQFGFKANLSTESAIMTLKHTVRYYTDRKTPIYACFLDLSKAFDLVSYPILWQKLYNLNLPTELINIFKVWYSKQVNTVRWANTMSEEYRLECGVRQGGLTSPKLFNLYINQLIEELSNMHVGCHIDNISVNNISYADDMVLLSPSIAGLRKLLKCCENYANNHGLKYNIKKSEVLIFKAQNKSPNNVPPICIYDKPLNIVNSFKYLGHIINNDLKDDMDIERERRALAVRCNMLARRFARCSNEVKLTLFRAYCQSFYSSSLWVRYTQKVYSALRVQYNNALRMLLKLPRFCSASGMFAQARVDGFHALMRKKTNSLFNRLRGSNNSILKTIAEKYDCPIQLHWMKIVTGQI